jgi:hypothetical protein
MLMARSGQLTAQCPHRMQKASAWCATSGAFLPSPGTMIPMGQTSLQIPQREQVSLSMTMVVTAGHPGKTAAGP